MRLTVIAGGVGGARFTQGLRDLGGHQVSVVVNVGDDWWCDGLRVCPDLDTQMYCLAGVQDTERGWGRLGESHRVQDELARWGAGTPWFMLGDLDIAAHLLRTGMLRAGASLTEVTHRLSSRWDLGVTLLPASDDVAETWVRGEDGEEMHFQEWWVRHRASIRPAAFLTRPGSGVLSPSARAAIEEADLVLIAPSNPVVSVGPVLALTGARETLAGSPAVVGVSPVVGGRVLRGMGDVCLAAVGAEVSTVGAADYLGARRRGGVLDGWLVDDTDEGELARLEAMGLATAVDDIIMRDGAGRVRVAARAVELGRRLLG